MAAADVTSWTDEADVVVCALDATTGALVKRYDATRRKHPLDGEAPGLIEAIHAAELVVIGPSNPYVSVDPILDRPGVRAALAGKRVIAVSPIIHGQAVKGPLATMIPELTGQPATTAAIAAHYGTLLAGMVVEAGDEGGLGALPVLGTQTVMKTRADSLRLARELLVFAESLPR